MRQLIDFVWDQAEALAFSPNVILVSRALLAGTAQEREPGRLLAAFGGTRAKRRELPDVNLNAPLEWAALKWPKKATMLAVVDVGFSDWAELGAFVRHSGSTAAHILVLVPTSSDAISQAALAQFETEAAIRLHAVQLSSDLHIVAQRDLASLAGVALPPLMNATLIGKVLQDMVSPRPDRAAVLAGAVNLSGLPVVDAPLFTVLTRTQGTRMETLSEVFLCLSAQTTLDFEHLVIAHNPAPAATAEISTLIARQSPGLQQRIRFETVVGGTRTTPLNAGFGMARGRYVIILDDDDIVFANWLEAFRDAAARRPGSLLRAVALRQEFTWATVHGKRAARAIGPMHRDYASTFDYLDHLVVSQTPPVSIAFPRYLFAQNGLTFDESLTTTEDWDYIMRCAARVGVCSTEEITSIYRWWVAAENSRTVHSQKEWQDNHVRIQDKIDQSVNLMEPGMTLRFRETSDKMDEYLRWANKLHHDLMEIQAATATSDIGETKEKIASLFNEVDAGFTSLLKSKSVDNIPLVPPNNDLLPEPQLSFLERIRNGKLAMEKLKFRQRRALVEKSGLFDPTWYCQTYPDVVEHGFDPLVHFVRHGSRELRSPSAKFNAMKYYTSYPDLRDQRIEPVFHFLLHGQREGRRFESHS
jgi:hypothetical protein